MHLKNPSLTRLIYVSTANHDLSDRELEGILEASRRRNQTNRVTGLLVYGDEHFFQVLEGEKEEVEQTMAKIRTDPRHGSLMVLSDDPCENRLFPDWSMAYQRLDQSELAEIPSMSTIFAGKTASAEMIQKLLQSFLLRLS